MMCARIVKFKVAVWPDMFWHGVSCEAWHGSWQIRFVGR